MRDSVKMEKCRFKTSLKAFYCISTEKREIRSFQSHKLLGHKYSIYTNNKRHTKKDFVLLLKSTSILQKPVFKSLGWIIY